MFPDLTYSHLYGEMYRHSFGNLEFDKWNEEEFIPAIQKRGAEVIKVRGSSSAGSAANAVVNHMRDWVYGTGSESSWVSMAIQSDGSYGIPKGLWSGFPVDCKPGENYKIVPDFPLSTLQEKMIKISVDEMMKEKNVVKHLLQ